MGSLVGCMRGGRGWLLLGGAGAVLAAVRSDDSEEEEEATRLARTMRMRKRNRGWKRSRLIRSLRSFEGGCFLTCTCETCLCFSFRTGTAERVAYKWNEQKRRGVQMAL